MKLQTKAVLGIKTFIVIACLCMGVLGYRSAADGFAKSLQESTVRMREHMHELHVGAKVMAETAQQSKAKAADGRKTVGQAVAQIKNIAEQVNVSAKVVGTLGKRSSEIGSIVETIQ